MVSNKELFEALETKEINVFDYWLIIWKRRWFILAVMMAVVVLVGIYSFTRTPSYRAKGTLLIEQDPNILTFEDIFQIESSQSNSFETHIEIIRSRALASRVVDDLGLVEKALASTKQGKPSARRSHSAEAIKRRLTDSIARRVKVNQVKQTKLVEVKFEDADPRFAADTVNAIFSGFIDMNIENKYAATEQATVFLTDQISSIRADIEAKEKVLQSYGAEKNIINLSQHETTILDKLQEMNKALTQATIDRLRKEANYSELKKTAVDQIPEYLSSPIFSRLREDYLKLSREYQKRLEKFKPDYPEMQRLKMEMDSARRSLQDEAQNLIRAAYSDYQSSLERERALESEFNSQKQEAINLNSNAISYNSLKIEIENKKNLLDDLLRRQNETGVAARLRGLRTSNIRVVDKAEVPLAPFSPKKGQNMLLALVIGIFVGIGLAFILDFLDNTVKTAKDVEAHTGLPLLGIVPAFTLDGTGNRYGYRRLFKTRQGAGSGPGNALRSSPLYGIPAVPQSIELITQVAPKSSLSENYRSIRTALLLSSTDPNVKALAFSSALPSEGKTTTICNLGISLAQADKKVLIVDADLRKPKQHRLFKVKNVNGLTNYLTSAMELKEIIKPTHIPNLWFVNAGPVPPNPTELLGSDKMSRLMADLKRSFDYILLDTPPLLAVADALVVGAKIDGLIIVVWGGKTTREMLKRAKDKLDLAKLRSIGVIINRINLKEHDSYYRYYYYDYYGDGEQRAGERSSRRQAGIRG